MAVTLGSMPDHTTVAVQDTAALERSALNKTIWRLVPILALGYFFNYVDRTSVGFAATHDEPRPWA